MLRYQSNPPAAAVIMNTRRMKERRYFMWGLLDFDASGKGTVGLVAEGKGGVGGAKGQGGMVCEKGFNKAEVFRVIDGTG